MMHYLKFTDEAEFLFEFDSYVDDEDGLVTSGVDYDFDVIGIIWEDVSDEEEEPRPLDGWHVNWLGELPEALQSYAIEEPNNPARVFAGHQPIKKDEQDEYL